MQSILAARVADNLSRKKPTSRTAFIDSIKESAGGTRLEVIDSHNTASVIFIISNNGNPILLKAEFGYDTATHKEIRWYEHQAAAGKDHQRLFISGERSDSFALLFLHYIEGVSTLDEWVLASSATGSEFGKFIVESLNYDKALFAETSKEVRQNVVKQFLLDRYRARREESKKTAYLQELLSVRSISVNDTRYLTPDYALKKLTSNPAVMARLLPTRTGLIHGDLHTGNVLIKGGELYYVDPNGTLDMPIEYDIGKLLHSIHGQYPLIMRGEFTVAEHYRGEYEYIVYANESYIEANDYLHSNLTHDEYVRGLFAEALHFATMLPHHAKNKEEATALFLRATELFGELLLLVS